MAMARAPCRAGLAGEPDTEADFEGCDTRQRQRPCSVQLCPAERTSCRDGAHIANFCHSGLGGSYESGSMWEGWLSKNNIYFL